MHLIFKQVGGQLRMIVFVAVYNTKEEAINHIKFQKEQMGSTAKWYYQYIKMSFGEHGTLN